MTYGHTPFRATKLVSGKATVGVNKMLLKEKIDFVNGLKESQYTAVTYQNAVTAAKNATAIYESLTSTQDLVDAQAALLTEAIDALVETQGDGNHFYFKNITGWEEVYAYWWGGATACPAFPGIKATPVAGREGYFYVEIPEDATGFNFNSGKPSNEGGQQTSSISKFEPGKILIIDPDSEYEKNGGIRYDAYYDILEKYTTGLDVLIGDVNGDRLVNIKDATSYFSRCFKRITRISVMQYLANIRLESALRDIINENKSVTDAAFDNGLTSVKSFIELCKKVYNCTPGQYKSKYN